MEQTCCVGIDVSKAHLDVYVRPLGDSFRVGHDDAGFVTLIARIRPLTPAGVVLEATGGYEVTVAATLAGAGLPVAVVNPRQIRDFARATGQLAKTDALDARVIALFAQQTRPPQRRRRLIMRRVAARAEPTHQFAAAAACRPSRGRPLDQGPMVSRLRNLHSHGHMVSSIPSGGQNQVSAIGGSAWGSPGARVIPAIVKGQVCRPTW